MGRRTGRGARPHNGRYAQRVRRSSARRQSPWLPAGREAAPFTFKGSFGSHSEACSRFAERLLTVAATGRQQGRSLLPFLVAAGEAALHGTTPPSLLPVPVVS